MTLIENIDVEFDEFIVQNIKQEPEEIDEYDESIVSNMKQEPEESSSSTREEQESSPDFEVDSVINSGTYGLVWNVKSQITGKRVALKQISDVFRSLNYAIMISREVRMLTSMNHENIIMAIEIVQPLSLDQFDQVGIVTELMSNDLDAFIDSPRPLTDQNIQVLMYQLLRGLKYIHSARILHLDIKPGNLLIDQNLVLKICDFGLARVQEADGVVSMPPNVGTFAYRAPEIVFAGVQCHYNGSVDMWSAACTFIELLTRRWYFEPTDLGDYFNEMVNLLGTPTVEDIWYAYDFINSVPTRAPQRSNFESIGRQSLHATDEVLDLLSRMMTFNPEKRITVAHALDHPYIVRGRNIYHCGMCTCCGSVNGEWCYTRNFEPSAYYPFDNTWEKDIVDVEQAREKLFDYIRAQLVPGRQFQ